jgi:hypothetical protein
MSGGLIDWSRAQRLYTERAQRDWRRSLAWDLVRVVVFVLLIAVIPGTIDRWLG